MIFSDDFNRSDQALADSNQWSSPRTGFRIVSNEVIIPSTGSNLLPSISCLANVDMPDQEAVLDVSAAEFQLFYGPSIRVDSSTGSGYHVTIGKLNSTVYGSINYIDSLGTLSVLVEDYTLGAGNSTWNQGETHTVKLRATGTTIELLVDNVVQLTTTNTQLTSGAPGFNAYYANNDSTAIASTTIDDFSVNYGAQSGAEVYLVSVGRHGFGSGANHVPNTIKDAEDKSEGFDDDPSTPLIDEAEVYGSLEADAYYVNGGYKYPTQGQAYRTADTLASDPIHLPPSYIYGGGTAGSPIDQQDPLQCHMLLEFWPEGYASRNSTDWTITSVTLIGNNAPSGNGYLVTPSARSDHFLLSIYNRKWPTYPFQEQYDCIMQDNTRAKFNTVAEAQAATNPSLLSLVELELPSTNEFTFTGTLRISYEHTNSNTFAETVGITQTVYNEFDKYISKIQTIAPPGTQLGPGSVGYPDLPSGD